MPKRLLPYVVLAFLLSACALRAGGLSETPTALDPTRAEPSATSAPTTSVPTSTATAKPTDTPAPSVTQVLSATQTSAPSATHAASPQPTATTVHDPETYYTRLIIIDQDTQTMRVFQNGSLIRTIPVSTGKPDSEETITPAWEGNVGRYVGTFFAFGTYQDDAWYLFEHYGSMLIHSAPYLKEDGKKVYQELDVLGVRPASHGCIRLPPDEAKWFSAWGPQGAHVIIKALTKPL